MSKLTALAKGQECQIRINGVCNGNPETTVAAHLNGGGMGMKRLDIHMAFACSNCHDEVDRRTKIVHIDFARQCHFEGVHRTQAWLYEHGYLTWIGAPIQRMCAMATETLITWVKRLAGRMV